MTDAKNIVYAYDRPEKAVRAWCRKHGIEITKHHSGKYDFLFIDFDWMEREELQAAKALCAPGWRLYLMQLGDLGAPRSVNAIKSSIEETGVEVIIPKDEVGQRGRKPEHGLTPEMIEKYGKIWHTAGNTQAYVIAQIFKNEGIETNRYKLTRLFGKQKK